MARDKLDVKTQKRLRYSPSSIRRISLKKTHRKLGQELALKNTKSEFFSSSFSPRKLHKPTSAT